MAFPSYILYNCKNISSNIVITDLLIKLDARGFELPIFFFTFACKRLFQLSEQLFREDAFPSSISVGDYTINARDCIIADAVYKNTGADLEIAAGFVIFVFGKLKK